MAGADEGGHGLAGHADKAFLESDALVALQDCLAALDLPIAVADDGGYVLDLVPLRFALVDGAAEQLERLDKERRDEMRLKPAGIGALHILTDLPYPGDIHRVMRQRPAFDQLAQVLAVQGMIDDLKQASPDCGLVAVADCLQEQLAEGTILEGESPQNVEDLAPQCFPLLVQLLQQAIVNLALACVFRDEIPQVANFSLADAVDAAKALLQPVGVPGQVVIHHEVSALQIDALARSVGGDQDLDFLVVPEGFLSLAPVFTADAAVDDDHGLRPTEQGANALGEVIQRVAVLRENHQLAAMPLGVEHLGVAWLNPSP